MSFADGVVNAISRYKRGFYFSPSFVGDHSWNGFENNLLFESLGNKLFCDVARSTGVDEIRDSRATCTVDLDLDGDLDLVIQNNHETPTIYLNNSKEKGRHLQIRLIGDSTINRDAIGTRVAVTYVDDQGVEKKIFRWVEAGNGYASQSQSAVHFGMGLCKRIVSISICWPDGSTNLIQNKLEKLIDKTVTVQKDADQIVLKIPEGADQIAMRIESEAGRE